MLLGVLLFNVYGYRLLLSHIEMQATMRLEERLDAGDYDANDLVEVKIPLNLPYHNNWSDYETYYGQVNYDGEYYQYVKRKVSNDTLYLLCLPHEAKTKINEARNDFFRSMTDMPQNGKSNSSLVLKFFQSEFIQLEAYTSTREAEELVSELNSSYHLRSGQFDPGTPSQPPEFCYS